VPTGKFGRLFPDLRPLVADPDALDALGDVMRDVDAESPAGDNPGIPAGYTYLGQFVDHDITFDPTALQEILVDPLALQNFRTPMLDLDCVYGSGPVVQPHLYARGDNAEARFEIGRTSGTPGGGDATVATGLPHDLPRAPHGFALIGDPRNDENLVVAQLHLAFLKFHNKVVDGLVDGSVRRESPVRKTPFEEARDLVIWHYQWIVLHDFLRRVLDPRQLEGALRRQRYYRPVGESFIPVEFSGAAYRFGHSMIRNSYDYNRVFTPKPGGVTPATLELLFQFTGLSGSGANVPIPSDWIIDWRRFFEVGRGATVGLTRRINPLLVDFLRDVPGAGNLATRNLKRGRMLGLPPGQSVARYMGIRALTPAEIARGADGAVAARHGFDVESPLWYYVLKEAEVRGSGERLGPVGSRIVAEVFVGLLRRDSSSFLARKPEWRPTLPAAQPGHFTMADLLAFVGELNPIGTT
jgi:hypothetical protein